MKNPLDELEPSFQAMVMEMADSTELTEHAVLKYIRTPRPEGMGVQVSREGYRAFVARKRTERMLLRAKETMEQAASFAKECENESVLLEGLSGLLQQRLFEGASGPMNQSELQALYRLAKQEEWKKEQKAMAKEKADVAREYLKLAKDRLQLSAAKLALSHAEDLRSVIVQGEARDGEKLQSALARLFGEKFAKAVEPRREIEDSTEGNRESETQEAGGKG